MKVINMTPHAINIVNDEGVVVKTYEPYGTVPRVDNTTKIVDPIDGVNTVMQMSGEVTGLPPAEPDTYLLVSAMVRAASPRADLISPDTGPGSVVRNDAGYIVGVRRFVK